MEKERKKERKKNAVAVVATGTPLTVFFFAANFATLDFLFLADKEEQEMQLKETD